MTFAIDGAGDDPRRSKDAGPPDEPRDPHGEWTSSGQGNVAQTKTAAFKEWFGESKVTNASGQPLVVYKAMYPYDYTKEKPHRIGEPRNDPGPEIESINRQEPFPAFHGNEPGVKIAGFFGGKETANRFAKAFGSAAVYPVYLKMENPYVIQAKGQKAGDIQFGATGNEFREAIRSGKHDGIIIKGTEDEGDVYVALKPENIKSAIGNKGSFDPKSPKITDSASTARDYDPGEPRDPRGRWTVGGLGGKPDAETLDAAPRPGGSFDPTGTSELRQRFRRAMDARWHRLRNLTSDAIAKSDILGIGGVSINSIQYAPLRGAGRVDAFQRWFAEGMRQAVTDGEGAWMAPYIAQAYEMGSRRARKLVGDPMRMGDDRSNMLAVLTISELHGVAGTTAQQATRAVAYGLGARQRPEKIARMVADRIKSVGRARSRTVVDYMVVKAFNAAILDTLRAAGVTWVHTIPEHLRGAGHLTDAVRKIPQKRHKKTGQFVPFKPQPSGYLIKKAKKEYRQHRALGEDVDVLTAGDDRVCDVCDDIAANGPYAIDTAEGLIPAHPNCRCSFAPASAVEAIGDFNPYHQPGGTGKGGQFASGFGEASATAFVEARGRSKRPEFLSQGGAEDLNGHHLLLNQDSTVGVGIDPQGDIQNVFNNGGAKGSGAHAMVAAIAAGGKTLDCYDGFLPSFYRQFGFRETGRMKFNPEFAHNWDPARGSPDVVFMAWRGYPDGGPHAAVERAQGRQDKIVNEHTDRQETDWDAAKQRSRAVAAGTQDHRGLGARQRSQADIARDQALARSSALHGSAVDAGPPDEPRNPHGEWTAGGGAGGKAVAGYSPGIVAKGAVPTEKKKQDWRETSPKSVDEHYAVASDNQAMLVRIAEEAARVANQGTKFANPGVKAKESLVRKLSTDKDRSPDEITDVVRAGFDVPSPEKADEVVSLLAKHAEVADRGWQTTAMGYFDRKAILRFHNGQMGEIQMWAPGMFDAKEKHGGHKLYEQSRVLPNDDPKLPELRNKQIELYGAVRAKLDPSVWGPIL